MKANPIISATLIVVCANCTVQVIFLPLLRQGVGCIQLD